MAAIVTHGAGGGLLQAGTAVLNEPVVNSPDWWESYFETSWESFGGSEQTRYFMKALVRHLPRRERNYLLSGPRRVLDWGCAFGEGVEELSRAFPECTVAGVDVSRQAIAEAKRRHPTFDFTAVDDGETPEGYDVIVTSNCLEHFERPQEIISQHLDAARSLYIALVPFEEDPLSAEHLVRFDKNSFPDRLGGFVRLARKAVRTDPAYWDGRQVLVVYGSTEHAGTRRRERLRKAVLKT